MKIALISLQSRSSQMIGEALKKYFDVVEDVDIRKIEVNLAAGKLDVLYDGNEFGKYDCIFARGSFRYAPLLRSITDALSPYSYMPIKAGAYTLGHDKLLTHLALQERKIPMPKTYITATPEAAKKILEKINYPIIMKFPSGTGGKGVMFAESFAAASSILDALVTLRQPFIIQEYVETGGIDIRAIVVGDRVVASMKRKADIGEKRANIHAGGVGEAVMLDAHTKNIAIETAKAINAEVCAVDILESPKGPLVVEANLSPGLQGITKATGIDVADHIAKYLFERTKESKEKGTQKKTMEIMEELGVEKRGVQEILTNLDIRTGRTILPKIVTEIGKLDTEHEYIIRVRAGKVVIEKSNIS